MGANIASHCQLKADRSLTRRKKKGKRIQINRIDHQIFFFNIRIVKSFLKEILSEERSTF